MSKHAPNPWTIAFRGSDPDHTSTGMGCGYGQSQIVDAKGRAIAGVAAVEPNNGPMYRNGTLSEETFEALEANARLIAAAPELLKALREAEYALEIAERTGHRCNRNDIALRNVRAAIATVEN